MSESIVSEGAGLVTPKPHLQTSSFSAYKALLDFKRFKPGFENASRAKSSLDDLVAFFGRRRAWREVHRRRLYVLFLLVDSLRPTRPTRSPLLFSHWRVRRGIEACLQLLVESPAFGFPLDLPQGPQMFAGFVFVCAPAQS